MTLPGPKIFLFFCLSFPFPLYPESDTIVHHYNLYLVRSSSFSSTFPAGTEGKPSIYSLLAPWYRRGYQPNLERGWRRVHNPSEWSPLVFRITNDWFMTSALSCLAILFNFLVHSPAHSAKKLLCASPSLLTPLTTLLPYLLGANDSAS